jgi:hypothetical protein
MKSIPVFICWMAALAVVRAEQLDNDQGRKGNQGQAAQVQSQGQPKAHVSANPKVYGNNLPHGPLYPNTHLNNNAYRTLNGRPVAPGQLQGRFQSHFSAAPNSRIASMKFNANNHIVGSEKWQGQKYSAFRSYHAQWHDHDWWRNHHNRIVLIGGGWYYWDAGFWYPAWGYDSAYSYYPYDGPIYAYNDLPPDQVIANVQASLQQQGYYSDEIDGLLGPLTRAALADYQRDHGLYTTAAIDQPTLASLGMG